MLLTQNISGTVLKNEISGMEIVGETEDHVWLKVGAGEVWHSVVLHTLDQGWSGLENLSLIPGNIGAAPMQNIGAYGVEIKDVFHELEAYIISDKVMQTFSLSDCQFGYRESIFKRALKNNVVICSVTLKLNKKPVFNTSYGAIESELERMNISELTAKAVSNAVISIRQSKLPDPAQIGNSGSFFKNPVIETTRFTQIREKHSDIVGYDLKNGETKVAAGWLIERAGFKGMRLGNYGVHTKQALVLVNYGGATGSDIYELSEQIIAKVQNMFGIGLEREVNVI